MLLTLILAHPRLSLLAIATVAHHDLTFKCYSDVVCFPGSNEGL